MAVQTPPTKEADMHTTEAPALPESLADIRGLERQAEDFEAQADRLLQKAQALRQIVGGVQALNGDAEAILTHRAFEAHRTPFVYHPPVKGAPRGPKAVMAVVAEQPERVW